MALICECRHCTTQFRAPNDRAGTVLACPVCQRPVSVPGASGGPNAPTVSTPSFPSLLDDEFGGGLGLASGGVPGTPGLDHGGARPISTVSGRRTAIHLSRRAAVGILVAGMVAFYSLVLAAVPKLGILLGWLILFGGIVVVFSGMVWQLYVAIREDTSHMIWAVLCPPYALYHLISRWDKTRKAFQVILAGLGDLRGCHAGHRLREPSHGAAEAGGRSEACAGSGRARRAGRRAACLRETHSGADTRRRGEFRCREAGGR